MPCVSAIAPLELSQSADNVAKLIQLPDEEAHQPGGGKVGRQEASLVRACCRRKRFGSEISATDGTFHCGGPAGCGPVAGEKDTRPGCDWSWTVGVDSRARRVSGVHFLDHRRLYEICLVGAGEEFADFTQSEIDNLGAGFFNQCLRRADDQFDIAACAPSIFILRAHGLEPRLVKHPLDRAIEQHRMIEICDLAIKPEVDTCDWRVLKVRDLFADRSAFCCRREKRLESLEGKRENQVIETSIGCH